MTRKVALEDRKSAWGKSLTDYRASINRECHALKVRPFSHNIISIDLQIIAKNWGVEEANRAICDFGLEKLGWKLNG